jgi:hypothetical protein
MKGKEGGGKEMKKEKREKEGTSKEPNLFHSL